MAEVDRDILVALRRLEEREGVDDVEDTPADADARAAADRLLAEIGASAQAVSPSADARERLLASTRPASRFEGMVDRVGQLVDLGEEASRTLLHRIAGRVEDLVGWVEGDIAGAHYFHFDGGPRVAEADCGLVRIEPGVEFPTHRHVGSEITIVLAGRAVEDGGSTWAPGDLVVREPGSVHRFRAIGDEPFVFVTVLGNGIEFC